MKVLRTLILTVVIAQSVILAMPATASTSGCSFQPTTATLTIGIDAGSHLLRRDGDAITYDGSACGEASVFNVDSIDASLAGVSDGDRVTFTISLRGGPFAPGATPDPSGQSEIEMSVDLSGHVPDNIFVEGSRHRDRLSLVGEDFSLNGDSDADVVTTGTAESAQSDCWLDDPEYPECDGLGLIGRGGNDILTEVTGARPRWSYLTVRGGGGNDHIDAQADVYAHDVQGDRGDDVMRTSGSVPLAGNDGADVLIGGPWSDSLLGGGGPDILRGRGADDFLDGGEGGDELSGGAGPDFIYGFNGNDTLVGGLGNDELRGEDGFDICDLDPADTVRDTCEAVP